MLDEANQRSEYKTALFALLGRFLTRPDDRALFGLPILAQETLHEALPEEVGDYANVAVTNIGQVRMEDA